MMTEETQPAYEAFVAERREQIMGRLRDAARRAGRDASEVTLLAVSIHSLPLCIASVMGGADLGQISGS